jgi:hypothetical protein
MIWQSHSPAETKAPSIFYGSPGYSTVYVPGFKVKGHLVRRSVYFGQVNAFYTHYEANCI